MSRAVYGIRNVAFFSGPSARGTVTYYATRADRDAALAALRDRAVDGGLSRSAAQSGISAVRRPVRGEASRQWLQDLKDAGELRPFDGPVYRWAE